MCHIQPDNPTPWPALLIEKTVISLYDRLISQKEQAQALSFELCDESDCYLRGTPGVDGRYLPDAFDLKYFHQQTLKQQHPYDHSRVWRKMPHQAPGAGVERRFSSLGNTLTAKRNRMGMQKAIDTAALISQAFRMRTKLVSAKTRRQGRTWRYLGETGFWLILGLLLAFVAAPIATKLRDSRQELTPQALYTQVQTLEATVHNMSTRIDELANESHGMAKVIAQQNDNLAAQTRAIDALREQLQSDHVPERAVDAGGPSGVKPTTGGSMDDLD